MVCEEVWCSLLHAEGLLIMQQVALLAPSDKESNMYYFLTHMTREQLGTFLLVYFLPRDQMSRNLLDKTS
jgi:hypothetical protein